MVPEDSSAISAILDKYFGMSSQVLYSGKPCLFSDILFGVPLAAIDSFVYISVLWRESGLGPRHASQSGHAICVTLRA